MQAQSKANQEAEEMQVEEIGLEDAVVDESAKENPVQKNISLLQRLSNAIQGKRGDKLSTDEICKKFIRQQEEAFSLVTQIS